MADRTRGGLNTRGLDPGSAELHLTAGEPNVVKSAPRRFFFVARAGAVLVFEQTEEMIAMRAAGLSARITFHIVLAAFLAALWGCGDRAGGQASTAVSDGKSAKAERSENVSDKIVKSDEEWRALLTPEQYRVTRECGTEPPFTGKYYNFKGEGTYLCVACGNELFSSATKYDSGSGWPSFYTPLSEERIEERTDRSHGVVRVEVRCGRCGAHLGHVFEDGPAPTGLRYCINSAALNFAGKDGEREIDKEKREAPEKSGE